MKKLLTCLLLTLSIFGLTGCGNQDQPTNNPSSTKDTTTVQIYRGSYLDLFDDSTRESLVAAYQGNVDEYLLSLVGSKLPDAKFKNYAGEEVELPKGETYVLEIVSPWCGFCKEMTQEGVIDEIVEANPNIKFYQYFGLATAKDVDDFYSAAETEMSDKITILLEGEELDSWLNENELYSVPMIVVVNEDGTFGLSNIGFEEASLYNDIIKLNQEGLDKPLVDSNKTFFQFMKEQRAAREYLKDIQEINVPNEYLK